MIFPWTCLNFIQLIFFLLLRQEDGYLWSYNYGGVILSELFESLRTK
jgi:hypothetical protein